MIGVWQGSRGHRSQIIWALLGILVGLGVAILPPGLTIAGVAAAGLGVLLLVEPALALVLMLGLAPLKTLIATEAPALLPVDLGQIGFGLVVGAWLVRRASVYRGESLSRTRVYWPLVMIIAAFSPSLFNALSIGDWLAELVKWIEMLLLVLIVVDLGRGGRWQWIAFGAVWAGVLQAVIGLYQYYGGSGAPHLWIADFQHFRAFGTFGQPNPFSAFMGLTLPLALGMGWGYVLQAVRERRHRVGTAWRAPASLALLYALSSMVLAAGLVVSWGRGAWLGFGAAAAVMVCLAPPRWWQALGLVTVAGAVVLAVWSVGLVPVGITARLTNALTEFTGFRDVRGVPSTGANYAIVERLAHWQAALAMADAQPIVGVGLGNYAAVYPAFSLISWPEALGHAHNEYLNVLAETGVVGLLGYLSGWAIILYWTVRACRQSDRALRGLALGLLGVWTHLVVHSVVDKLYVNNLFLHLGVMLGLLAIVISHTTTSGAHEYSDS